jgi:hypothetical protein
MYPAILSLAETLCQGWDGLASKLASNQFQSPVGLYGLIRSRTIDIRDASVL